MFFRGWQGLLLGTLLLGVALESAAQDYLIVRNPEVNWWTEEGTLEEAYISVRPKGLYMEYGLYLTFSARHTGFSSSDQLEVEYRFSLPGEALLTDSWLWVGDDIIRAEILDVWTASSIYEDIVDRRRDPSLLFERGPGEYELRIYPMRGDETRKVKLTYLLPATWTQTEVQAALPLSLLQHSLVPLDEAHLLTYPDDRWRAPRLSEEQIALTPQVDEDGDSVHVATLPKAVFADPPTLTFDAPLTEEGLFLQRYEEQGEAWYELAMMPLGSEPSHTARRAAVLIDYEGAKTSTSASALMGDLRAALQTHLTPSDSFNVFLSRLQVTPAAPRWLPAHPDTIDQVFDTLGTALSSYSNLPGLLAAGLAFVEAQPQGGDLLLLSSSDQVGASEVANSLLADLRAQPGLLPPVHVFDFTESTQYHTIGGETYRGNEYFYTNLAKISAGTYVRHWHQTTDLRGSLSTLFAGLEGTFTAFDLYTSLDDGVCYGRFTLDTGALSPTRPVLQVGQYVGTFPFTAEAAGLYNGQTFVHDVDVEAADAFEADSTLAQFWTSQQISLLESQAPTNDRVAQIINYSLDRRVLSLYTAFLALEVEQGGEVCVTCGDETDNPPVGVEDQTPGRTEAQLSAYPNPFRSYAVLVVELPAPVEAADVTFEIYDVMGRRVRTLQPPTHGPQQRFELRWEGTNDAGAAVASGTYLLVVTTPTGRYTLALTRVR